MYAFQYLVDIVGFSLNVCSQLPRVNKYHCFLNERFLIGDCIATTYTAPFLSFDWFYVEGFQSKRNAELQIQAAAGYSYPWCTLKMST